MQSAVRHDAHVSRAWRVVFTLLFLILVGGAGYGVVTYTHHPLPPTRENVEIVATLEGHTKSAGNSGNAITTFLTLPGTVTWISPDAEFTPTNIQTREERTDLVYALKVHVANQDGVLKIGMPADVQFIGPGSPP